MKNQIILKYILPTLSILAVIGSMVYCVWGDWKLGFKILITVLLLIIAGLLIFMLHKAIKDREI